MMESYVCKKWTVTYTTEMNPVKLLPFAWRRRWSVGEVIFFYPDNATCVLSLTFIITSAVENQRFCAVLNKWQLCERRIERNTGGGDRGQLAVRLKYRDKFQCREFSASKSSKMPSKYKAHHTLHVSRFQPIFSIRNINVINFS